MKQTLNANDRHWRRTEIIVAVAMVALIAVLAVPIAVVVAGIVLDIIK